MDIQRLCMVPINTVCNFGIGCIAAAETVGSGIVDIAVGKLADRKPAVAARNLVAAVRNPAGSPAVAVGSSFVHNSAVHILPDNNLLFF